MHCQESLVFSELTTPSVKKKKEKEKGKHKKQEVSDVFTWLPASKHRSCVNEGDFSIKTHFDSGRKLSLKMTSTYNFDSKQIRGPHHFFSLIILWVLSRNIVSLQVFVHVFRFSPCAINLFRNKNIRNH